MKMLGTSNEWKNSLYTSRRLDVLHSKDHLEITTEETSLPIIPWKGESMHYKPAQEQRTVSALSGTFVAVRREVFTLLGGTD